MAVAVQRFTLDQPLKNADGYVAVFSTIYEL